MYAGVVAILVYFTITPIICELGAHLYNKGGKKR